MTLLDIFTIGNYNYISWLVFKFVWVQNVVCYAEGRGKIECTRIQSVEENICIWEGRRWGNREN
jgi:hypothetical protein